MGFVKTKCYICKSIGQNVIHKAKSVNKIVVNFGNSQVLDFRCPYNCVLHIVFFLIVDEMKYLFS